MPASSGRRRRSPRGSGWPWRCRRWRRPGCGCRCPGRRRSARCGSAGTGWARSASRGPDRRPGAWTTRHTTHFEDLAAALCDEVLFGQVWERLELSPKVRSLITVAALTTSGNTDQLVYHLGLAKKNGATETELIEAITHLAFYAGWPKAMSAMTVARRVFQAS